MNVTIRTKPALVIPDKITDLSKPGNRKWLTSHILWAMKHDYEITISLADEAN